MPYVCRQIELGRSGFFPETMVKWEETPIPRPYMYLRILSTVAYAEFCAPQDILESAWSDIVACAITASGTIGITTIIAGPEKALAVFESEFRSCLVAKLGEQADTVQVSLSARQQPSKDWHR